jgi:ubiquitin-activating enzyme E1 C
LNRASAYGIEGVNIPFTLGVIKHIIPAIASTNSYVSGLVCNEVLKLGLQLYTLRNYLQYSGEVVWIFVFVEFYFSK